MYSFGIKISSLYSKLAFFKYEPHDIVEKKKNISLETKY